MFKIVISDPESRKTWQTEKDVPTFVGMKIGQKFDGSAIGLNGYTLEITGGSDKEGFPMRRDIEGVGRKKAFLIGGVGYKSKGKGVKKRRSVRGNTISEQIVQVNVKVAEKKQGVKPVPDILGLAEKPVEEKPAEPKKEEPKKEKEPEEKKEEPAPEEEKKEEEKAPEEKEEEPKPEVPKEEPIPEEKPKEEKPAEEKKEEAPKEEEKKE